MTINEFLKNTNYEDTLFSEDARKHIEDAIITNRSFLFKSQNEFQHSSQVSLISATSFPRKAMPIKTISLMPAAFISVIYCFSLICSSAFAARACSPSASFFDAFNSKMKPGSCRSIGAKGMRFFLTSSKL